MESKKRRKERTRKKIELIEVKSRIMVVTGWGEEMLVKPTKLQFCKMSKSRSLMYNMMTIANNTILNIGNMMSGALITCIHKKGTMRGDDMLISLTM